MKPGNSHLEYKNLGWQQAENGKYWYRNQDASYIQTNWLNENGNWYFFDADGWMVTNNYASWGGKDYYFGADGTLQTTGKAPDGRKVEANGALEGASKYGVQADEDAMFNQGPGMKL